MNRIFFYPDNTRYVLFTEKTLYHMYAHIQRKPWQKEAGGEVYSSDPDSNSLIIHSATGPSVADIRRRCSWNPDVKASDRNRQIEFSRNRHVVGLWHTHPEINPSPSAVDQKTTWDYLEAFEGDRSRYFMVIIGNHGRVPRMAVWVASYKPYREWVRLCEASSH